MPKKGDWANTGAASLPVQLVGLSSSWYNPPGTQRRGNGAPVHRYEVPLALAVSWLVSALLSSPGVVPLGKGISEPRDGLARATPQENMREGHVLVIFIRYAFALNPSPFLSITCAVIDSG